MLILRKTHLLVIARAIKRDVPYIRVDNSSALVALGMGSVGGRHGVSSASVAEGIFSGSC